MKSFWLPADEQRLSAYKDTTLTPGNYRAGEWIARVTYTDCGALSDGTAVTLRRTQGWFARDKLVVGLDGSYSVGITWRDARTLRIFLPESAKERNFADQKIFNRHEDIEEIHIEYTQL